ncbi:serine protease [Mesorhizobium sp. WSM2561]|uniref:serine protease n=1 Tax=Mesorhizobium sp. WSM2561 TaxID=1040985 RepID=UPI0004B1AB07|nr:serine protease [Mesorhizobium sp. WSM2561]
MNKNIRAAIAKITVGREISVRGTAFLIEKNLVATALHCVADHDVEVPLDGDTPKWLGTINLEFPGHATTATPLRWNYTADCVLLKCDGPPTSQPLPLQALPRSRGHWETFGFPNMQPLDGIAIDGRVTNHSGELYGTPAIQLYSKQLAAGIGGDPRGFSGGPVLVRNGVVGLVRFALGPEDRSVAGTAYACPSEFLAELDPTLKVRAMPKRKVGPGSVFIENFTFYNRAPDDPAETASGEPVGPCPYPGLAYFGPNDAGLFFGRDAAITRLVEAVGRQSFTALVGASGSGKSSVVLAGLAPRLHSGGGWRFSHFRIGTELERDPFLALSRALAPLYVASDSDVERLRNTKLLAASLQAGELSLRDVFADCRSRNTGRRILLIADQFEEAFTLIEDDAVRNRFIDVLLAGFPDPAAGTVPDICLMLTIRGDFYGRAQYHRQLNDALQNHTENLGPMTREELQAAIIRPAENAGVAFEPGLVETLLDTVESQPGGLPLLQFALREMWGRQERKKITRKSYNHIGGIKGALAQRAEAVFLRLTKNGHDAAMDKAFQRLFTRLVTLGEGQEDTRRVVEKAELGDEVWGLAQRLAGEENRLVVTNTLTARETVEVVHEALIHHWPRLVEWINRDRDFQSWLRQSKLTIELWLANREDEGLLLRGGMLAQANEWLAKRRDDLSQTERDFIEVSLALRQKMEAEKEALRQAEISRQHQLAEAATTLAMVKQERAQQAIKTERGLDLSQRGWGAIFPQNSQSNTGALLQKLLEHRRNGAGSKYLELAYRPGETARQLLARYGADSGALDPIPYYLLIVGSPEQIPYSMQYELAIDHAVGRIFFEQPEQYSAYADSVVHAETATYSGSATALIFGPTHENDITSEMGARWLLEPVTRSFEEEKQSWTSFDWSLTKLIGESATKSQLTGILRSGKPPALLFIASHGLSFSKDDPRQKELAGAILCAEFAGRQAITEDMYFSALDSSAEIDLKGTIVFAFVGYSAGTPRFDDFEEYPAERRRELANYDLMSKLPMRWLGIPDRRGALAFIGHVDTNWAFSIEPLKTGPTEPARYHVPSLFTQALRQLMNGYTVGLAMEGFRRRFALNVTLLVSELLPSSTDETVQPNAARRAAIDIRNYVIIGDPAVSSPARQAELR